MKNWYYFIDKEKEEILEKRTNQFLESFKKGELYPVSLFSSWTGALAFFFFFLRNEFLRKRNYSANDKCNVSFWLKEISQFDIISDLISDKIFDYYGSEEPVYIKEENSNE